MYLYFRKDEELLERFKSVPVKANAVQVALKLSKKKTKICSINFVQVKAMITKVITHREAFSGAMSI